MARLWYSGFESGSNVTGVEWDTCNGAGASVQGTTVRSGAFAGKILNPASGVRTGWAKQFQTAGAANTYFRYYLRIHTLPNVLTTISTTETTTSLTAGVTPQIGIRLTTGGVLQLYDASGAGIIGSSSALNLDQWYRVEGFMDVISAGGSNVMTARLDGTQFATNTTMSLSGSNATLQLGANLLSETCTAGEWCIDDVAVNNDATTTTGQDSWPGAGSVFRLFPAGAGDFSEGSATGAATGWQATDETPPDDITSYWSLVTQSSSSSTADRLDVTVGTFTPSAASITCVQVGFRFAGASAASCNVITRIKSIASGTIAEGTALVNATTTFATNGTGAPKVSKLISFKDPSNVGNPWTTTLLASMQIGIRSTDTTPNPRVTALWADVEYVPGAGAAFDRPCLPWMTYPETTRFMIEE